jgi:hypothetical protein
VKFLRFFCAPFYVSLVIELEFPKSRDRKPVTSRSQHPPDSYSTDGEKEGTQIQKQPYGAQLAQAPTHKDINTDNIKGSKLPLKDHPYDGKPGAGRW